MKGVTSQTMQSLASDHSTADIDGSAIAVTSSPLVTVSAHGQAAIPDCGLERSVSLDGSDDGNDPSLNSDSSLSDQFVMDRTSTSVMFRRMASTGYEPFRRTGSFMSNSRSSRASDTSSGAFSVDSDGFVVSVSSLNDGRDDMVVDSDNDDSVNGLSLIVRDRVREFLEKVPADRTDDDIEVLMDFMQHMPAFSNMTQSMRRSLCSVMEFVSVELAGSVVLSDGDQLTHWSVVLNGHLEVSRPDGSIQHFHMGDSFGIPPTCVDLPTYHCGVMRTKSVDCQYVSVTQEHFYRILHLGEESITRIEENGELVMVMERRKLDDGREGQLVLRATAEKLVQHLMTHSPAADPTYINDFLLTCRTFLKSPTDVADNLLSWFDNAATREKSIRIVLRWVNSSPSVFEADKNTGMWDFVEKFESMLESNGMEVQLKQLCAARSTHSRRRSIVLSRNTRDEILYFNVIGGLDRGGGIFVTKVDQDSKPYEAGLRRGDQILEVNNHNFERISHATALQVLRGNTHLAITVRFNVLGLRELRQQTDGSPRRFSRKDSTLSSPRRQPVSDGNGVSYCAPAPSNSQSLSKASGKDLGLQTSKLRRALLKFTHQTRNDASDSQLGQYVYTSTDRSTVSRKGSTLSDGLLIGLSHPHRFASDPDLSSLSTNDGSDDMLCQYDGPEHVVKVFRADQAFRYLLVHKETTAREVVMLSLTEFGISDPSCQYSLCEVTFGENGLMKTRQLADQLDNLAERASINCRYYLRNNTTMDVLVPDDVTAHISREIESSLNGSLLLLRAVSSADVAVQLTRRDFELFRSIEPAEYINDLFELEDQRQTCVMLARFSELVNEEMFWVATEVCSEVNVIKRMRIVKQFIKIAKHCRTGRNFNSMFAILSGLGHGSVARLKQTWEKLPSKYVKMFEEMQELMDPSRNMSKYRTMLNAHFSQPPVIPFFPLVKKDLTFIHFGNDSRVDGLVNFEKLRMISKEVRQVTALARIDPSPYSKSLADGLLHQPSAHQSVFYESKPMNASPLSATPPHRRPNSASAATLNAKKMFEQAQLSRRVQSYLTSLKVINDESKLSQLSSACEPPGKSNGRRLDLSESPTTSSYPDNILDSVHGPMFGTDSPQAVRKIMLLSDKVRSKDGKKKPPATQPVSLVTAPKSPGPSISVISPQQRRQRHRLPAVDLSLESSSVTGRGATSSSSSSFISRHSAVPVALASSSRLLVNIQANGAVRQKEVGDTDVGLTQRNRAVVTVRQTDSDSGRSSLASNDNHSIGSDISPTLNTPAGRVFVSHRHPSSPRVIPQPLTSSVEMVLHQTARPSHPPSYYVATRRCEAPTRPVCLAKIERLQLPDYYTATKMLAERRGVPMRQFSPQPDDRRRRAHSCDRLLDGPSKSSQHHLPVKGSVQFCRLDDDFSSDEDGLVSAV